MITKRPSPCHDATPELPNELMLPYQALTGVDRPVDAVAVGALPDGTPVIVSGSSDRTVRAWRLADGTPLAHPLDLSESAGGIALHGNIIVTPAGPDIAVHHLAAPWLIRDCSLPSGHGRPTRPPDNGRLSGTTRAPASDHAGGGPPSFARLGHVIRYLC